MCTTLHGFSAHKFIVFHSTLEKAKINVRLETNCKECINFKEFFNVRVNKGREGKLRK